MMPNKKILFLSGILFSQIILAEFKCQDIFVTASEKRLQILESIKQPQSKGFLGDLLGKKSTPAPFIEIKHSSGKVPVVLANAETVASLKDTFDHSMGIIVQHQPGYRNDHGMFRLSDNFIDLDSPGYRARGELYQTGISWAPVTEYLNYAYKRAQPVRVEILFKLDEYDLTVAKSYQLMRRSAIVRAPFSFGGAKNNLDQQNMLKYSGENCFSFCQGSYVQSQISEIRTVLMQTGFDKPEAVLENSDFKAELKKIKQTFFSANPNDTKIINPQSLAKFLVPKIISENKLWQNLSDAKKNEALNYFIGMAISIEYKNLLQRLEVRSGSGFESLSSSEVAAVVIYDSNVTEANFKNKNYTSPGIFTTWTNADMVN
jgi:hypothetical protein